MNKVEKTIYDILYHVHALPDTEKTRLYIQEERLKAEKKREKTFLVNLLSREIAMTSKR